MFCVEFKKEIERKRERDIYIDRERERGGALGGKTKRARERRNWKE